MNNGADAPHHARKEPPIAIEYRDVDSLIPYINNARVHDDEQIAQIAASIKEYGWTNPMLVDGKNGIIAGHGRLEAARKLGLREVPVIELQGLSDAQRRAYVLADNRLAQTSTWDMGLLEVELTSIIDNGFELSKTGFDLPSLHKLGLNFHEEVEFEEVVYGEENGTNPASIIDQYEASSIRTLLLAFMADQYKLVIEALGSYADTHGLSNNTEVVLHLLETNGYAVNTRNET